MSTTSNTSGGIGFAAALTLLFIGLKLGGVISWSWWWVLSPLWISWAIALFVMLVMGVIVAVTR